MMKTFQAVSLVLSVYGLILGFATNAQADQAVWQLNPAQSSVHFISVKKEHIAEVHDFKTLEGKISPDGMMTVDIALASVQTNIDIRNQRMRNMLFEVDKFATASISANVKSSLVTLTAAGTPNQMWKFQPY